MIGLLNQPWSDEFFKRWLEIIFSKISDLASIEHCEIMEASTNARRRRCSSPSPTRDYDDAPELAASPSKATPLCDREAIRQRRRDLDKWKELEIWAKCLHCLLEPCESFEQIKNEVDATFFDKIALLLSHKDRYVRESAFQIVGDLLKGNKHSEIIGKLVPILTVGLSDNWSHVRMAACVATREFFLGDNQDVSNHFPSMLPPLCLNRYHLAEGVRNYSQETWKLVTKGEGKQLVEKHLPEVVSYYVQQCDAKNHAIREAALLCIAELAIKMEHSLVSLHVSDLLDAVVPCYEDDSWPVRDGACQASAKFLSNFPEESREKADPIVDLMAKNLCDSIPGVRAGAASALTMIATTYKGDVLKRIVENILFPYLEIAMTQPDEANRFADPETIIVRTNTEQTGKYLPLRFIFRKKRYFR